VQPQASYSSIVLAIKLSEALMEEAYRIVFEYKQNKLERQSITKIPMRAPPNQLSDNVLGWFVELQDSDGVAVYRHQINDPLPTHIEYPSDDAERPFGQADVQDLPILISVLVPARDDGRKVSLIQNSAGEGVSAFHRREFFVVDLPVSDGRQ
jgi:hypothetical protein